jgi:hypothetical protein
MDILCGKLRAALPAALFLLLAGQVFALDAAILAETALDPETGYFSLSYSSDGGRLWSRPFVLTKNGSAVKAFRISTAEAPPTAAWIETKDGYDRIFFYKAVPGYGAKEIAAVQEAEFVDIAGQAPSAPFVVFSGADALYMLNSVDGGKNWSSLKTYRMEQDPIMLDCTVQEGMISVFTGHGTDESIPVPPPAAPGFLSENLPQTDSGSLEVPFVPSPGAERFAVAHIFEVSPDKDFKNPFTATIEADVIRFSLPQDLKFGQYFCRIAAWNGLAMSYSPVKTIVYIDGTALRAPKLRLIKPSSIDWIRNGSIAVFEISATDPQDDIEDGTEASAYLNGTTLEASLSYDKMSGTVNGFAAIPDAAFEGTNILKVVLKDSHGNAGSMEAGINIDPLPPVLGLTLSNKTAYSNSRDRITVPLKDDGAGPDLHNSSIKVFSAGATLEGSQSSDGASRSLIFTPARSLDKDIYSVEIVPRDLAGNIGEKILFTLKIDQVAPNIALDPTTSETTAPLFRITGTVDKDGMSGVSVSRNSSPARPAVLRGGHFSAEIELDRGDNKITVTAKDLAGNSAISYASVFLSVPPDTAFFKFDGVTVCSGDFVNAAASSIKIVDEAGLGISSGTVKLDGADVAYDDATGDVSAGPFSPGAHVLALTADAKTYTLSFTAEDSLRIGPAVACPSPFNPNLENTGITYNVSKDCDVTAYIFDTGGTLVWKGSSAGTTGFNSGIAWNGRSLDGRPLSNGVYIIRLIARDSSGSASAGSGKVVLLK